MHNFDLVGEKPLTVQQCNLHMSREIAAFTRVREIEVTSAVRQKSFISACNSLCPHVLHISGKAKLFRMVICWQN